MSTATATERAALADLARDLARDVLAPRACALDDGDRAVLADCRRQLAQAGFDRALLPAGRGGVGLAPADLLAALEELAYGDGGSAMDLLLANAALVALGESAAPAEDERWTLVTATPQEVRRARDGLHGAIACALGAADADAVVLVVPGAPPQLLAAASGGVAIAADEAQMGLRAAPAAAIALRGAVPIAEGTAADGETALALLRAGTAAVARGIARRAYEEALSYAHARRQGGVAIVEHDAVAGMLAAMAVRLACPPPDGIGPAAALAAKVAATEAALETATDAVQVFGGAGYTCETGVEKLMRDAQWCALFPEPNWVARGDLLRAERARRGGSA